MKERNEINDKAIERNQSERKYMKKKSEMQTWVGCGRKTEKEMKREKSIGINASVKSDKVFKTRTKKRQL